MNRLRLTAALIGAMAIATPFAANAATFNFAAMADSFMSSQGYEGSWNQVTDWNGTRGSLSDSGVTITSGQGSYYNSTQQVWKNATTLFDSSYGMNGLDAGLGVCHHAWDYTLNRSTCSSPTGNHTSDDNIGLNEKLTLGMDQTVSLTGLIIRDANHNLITNDAAILINGISYGANNGIVNVAGALTGSSFDFAAEASGSPQLYISEMSVSPDTTIETLAPVPLPATLTLLPSALFIFNLLFGRRRRPRAAAAA